MTKPSSTKPAPSSPFAHRVQNIAAQSVLRGALLLPYATRVRFVGWLVQTVVAPLAGWNKRVRDNLHLVLPETPDAETRRIAARVANNVGRTLIEIYSGDDFLARVKDAPQSGPGLSAIHDAQKQGRPIVLLTAHIGNYDAVRGSFAMAGQTMAALYKPMRNTIFNDHYVKAVKQIASPAFPTTARGLASLISHLKKGGTIGIVGDIGSTGAPLLEFFGHPAHTPVSAAEWAIKYDALMVPIYGLRQPDGLTFNIFADTPNPNGDPNKMMQAYNDSVEAVTRDHMDQWFWIHKRWKRAANAVDI
jgi:KDO2-lipid IV(A) lauroyltransferase